MQSVHNDEEQNLIDTISTLDELQKNIEVKLDSVIDLKKDLTTGIHDSSSLFVREGLEELTKFLDDSPDDKVIEAHDKLSVTINNCGNEGDVSIELATIKFADVERKINSVLDAIKKVKNNSEPEQLIEQLKDQYQSIVTSDIAEFLTELKLDFESVPLYVKTCVDKVSVLAPLILCPDRRFSELLSENEKLWFSLVDEKTELINQMHDECSSYILQGLGKAQQVPNVDVQSDKFNKTVDTIFKCGTENDLVIDVTNLKFNELLEEAKEDISAFAKDNRMKFKGTTLDDVSGQRNDVMKEYTEIFYSRNANLRAFLDEFKQQSISAPVNVKACIEEAVDLLTNSPLNRVEL